MCASAAENRRKKWFTGEERTKIEISADADIGI